VAFLFGFGSTILIWNTLIIVQTDAKSAIVMLNDEA
jgi:hypothetical protein